MSNPLVQGKEVALGQLSAVLEDCKHQKQWGSSGERAKNMSAALAAAHCANRWGSSETMYRNGAKDIRELSTNEPYAAVVLAVSLLEALRQEIANGGLVRIAATARKAVTEDLLTQAEDLANSGYDRAALVVAGAALEQHLRKLGNSQEKADVIITSLQQSGTIDKNEAKQLRWAYGLRNTAAHGEPLPEVEGTDLLMIQSARAFVNQHPN
jgi:hypothetical protein